MNLEENDGFSIPSEMVEKIYELSGGVDKYKVSMSNTEYFLVWNYTSLTLKGVLSSSKFIIKQIISLLSKKNAKR